MALLAVAELSKRLEGRSVLEDLSFQLDPGQGLCVMGPNGSGKTTLLNCLATLWRPTAGTIRWEGEDVFAQRTIYRRQIGYLSHRPMVYPEWSGRRNLQFFAALYGLAEPERRIEELLELVDLRPFADDPSGIYSRGMLQRLAVARALLHRPRLLLLDEPFAGLDRASVRLLRAHLRAERERGTTLVLVTHDADVGVGLAEQVLRLERGRSPRLEPFPSSEESPR